MRDPVILFIFIHLLTTLVRTRQLGNRCHGVDEKDEKIPCYCFRQDGFGETQIIYGSRRRRGDLPGSADAGQEYCTYAAEPQAGSSTAVLF